jgi:DNA primase
VSPPIPQDYIDDLLARSDLVALIGARVELRRSGHEYIGRCPFHEERTPSFTVSPQKGFYHCFGCGAHGSALGFLMAFERLEFPEAVRRLAEISGLPPPPGDGGAASPRHGPLYDLLEDAAALYRRALAEDPAAQAYLRRRGIRPETVARYALGYAPPKGALGPLFTGGGTRLRLLEEAGLVRRRGGETIEVFRHRLLFPIRDTRGRTVGFGGRALEPEQKPKYLNSPEGPLFHKGQLLYGHYEARLARRRGGPLLVVEGYMDVLALAQGGFDPAVACLGTALTEIQAERLFHLESRVVFCFDGDEAGRRAAGRSLERLLPLYRPEWRPAYLELPEGEDPDTLLAGEGAEGFGRRLEKALPMSAFFFIHLERSCGPLDTIEARTRYAAEARRLLASVRDPVFRDLLDQELQKKLGIRPAPAGGRRPARSARPPAPDAMRRLLHLLVHYPGLATELPEEDELGTWEFRGTEFLKLLRRRLREDEETPTTQELLARFPPGGRERVFLERLAAREILLDPADARLEIRATVDLLRRRVKRDREAEPAIEKNKNQ